MSDHHHDSEATRERGTLQTRRSFLRTSVLGAAASWTLPAFIDQTFARDERAGGGQRHADRHRQGRADPGRAPASRRQQRVEHAAAVGRRRVPRRTAHAWESRRTRRCKPERLLRAAPVADGPLKGLYDEGHMAVVQGVGYPNPNRSHFRSTEIWQTAADSNRNKPYGWLGSYFDSCCQGAAPTVGVAIGGQIAAGVRVGAPDRAFPSPTQSSSAGSTRGPSKGSMSSAEYYYRQINAPESGRRRHGGRRRARWTPATTGAASGRLHGRRRGARLGAEFAGFPRAHGAGRAAKQRQGARNRAQDQARRGLPELAVGR